MGSRWVYIMLLLGGCFLANSQRYNHIYDGPYIEELDNSFLLQWIEKGKKKSEKILKNGAKVFNVSKLPSLDLSKLDFKEDIFQAYENVDKYIAISDIHGQHDLFIELLQKHSVIDSTQKWIYDKGHLVIVGDMFDRGDQVTEVLWFLFYLEQQAALAGGKVHVLLGNHELMILHEDVQYISPKYRYVTGAFGIAYPDLYSESTVLGRWLRSKNIVAIINRTAFVHGGFSREVIKKENSVEEINSIFKNEIYNDKKITREDNFLGKLYFDNGPLWYRGYASPDGFDVEQANHILETLDIERVVVGHTSMPRIVSLHNHKIVLIDSSIKFGKSGELLIYEQDSLYRGQLDGSRVSLSKKERSRSPFEYVYDLGDGDLAILLNMDVKKLIKSKMEEKYQRAKLLAYHNGEFNREWSVKVKARGNMRKKLCKLPPLKIDFSKSTLSHLGFSQNDKLKVVLPCDDSDQYQQGLYREYVTYKLYEKIDSLALRTRLTNFILKQKKKVKYDFTGMVVEDEENYVLRTGNEMLGDEQVLSDAIEREQYLRMVFFQYMIRNTDWALFSKHNIEMIKCKDEVVAIPYDFDYAGIVDQDYADKTNDVPITEASPAYFKGKNVTMEEVERMYAYYLILKQELYQVLKEADFLNDESLGHMQLYLDQFYLRLENKKDWRANFKISD